MRSSLLRVGLLVIVFCGAADAVSAQDPAVAPPVAHVDQSDITRAEFDHWMAITIKGHSRSDATAPAEGSSKWVTYRNETLKGLLEWRWATGEAELQGVEMTEKQFARAVAAVKSAIGRKAHKALLHQTGMTDEDFATSLRPTFLLGMLVEQIAGEHRSKKAKRKAIKKFEREWRARWKAKTTCDPAFMMKACGGEIAPPAEEPAPPAG